MVPDIDRSPPDPNWPPPQPPGTKKTRRRRRNPSLLAEIQDVPKSLLRPVRRAAGSKKGRSLQAAGAIGWIAGALAWGASAPIWWGIGVPIIGMRTAYLGRDIRKWLEESEKRNYEDGTTPFDTFKDRMRARRASRRARGRPSPASGNEGTLVGVITAPVRLVFWAAGVLVAVPPRVVRAVYYAVWAFFGTFVGWYAGALIPALRGATGREIDVGANLATQISLLAAIVAGLGGQRARGKAVFARAFVFTTLFIPIFVVNHYHV
jgi:hypothetical protein